MRTIAPIFLGLLLCAGAWLMSEIVGPIPVKSPEARLSYLSQVLNINDSFLPPGKRGDPQ